MSTDNLSSTAVSTCVTFTISSLSAASVVERQNVTSVGQYAVTDWGDVLLPLSGNAEASATYSREAVVEIL